MASIVHPRRAVGKEQFESRRLREGAIQATLAKPNSPHVPPLHVGCPPGQDPAPGPTWRKRGGPGGQSLGDLTPHDFQSCSPKASLIRF